MKTIRLVIDAQFGPDGNVEKMQVLHGGAPAADVAMMLFCALENMTLPVLKQQPQSRIVTV